MKTLTKTLLAVVALLAASVCASTVYVRGAGAQTGGDGRHFYRLGDRMRIEGFDVEIMGGRAVGLSLLQQDGRWLPLREKQGGATCSTFCPQGVVSCWEDEEAQMSVCICLGSEDPGAGITAWQIATGQTAV